MTDIGAISGLQAQAVQQELSVRIADKVLEAVKQRGEAALRLLDSAAAGSQQGAKGGPAPDPSGISGRQVDLLA